MTSADYRPTRDLIAAGRRILTSVDARGPGAIRFAVYADRTLAPLPALTKDWMVERLVGLLHSATGQLREQLDTAEELVDAAGTPSGLRAAADELDARVGKPGLDLAPLIRLDVLEAAQASAWTGSGAEMYRAALEGQGASVERISTYAGVISTSLRGTADALEQFVSQVTVAVLSAVAACISLFVSIAGACTVMGFAVAMVAVIGAAIGLAAAIVGAVGAFQSSSATLATLARAAHPSIQSWPNARFGGRRA